MTDRQLGAAVVGTVFGAITQARALRKAGIEVVALVGRDAAKTKLRAEVLGIPNALTDVDAALALPGVDVVAVATPPHTHAAIVLAAVAAGKHVLCEKPFARDLREAEAMLAAAERAGVVHVIGHEFRFGTGQATLRRAVRSGAIGEALTAIFALQVPFLADPAAPLPAWWESAAEGGGWLQGYGVHVVDQIRVTIGEFEALSASLQRIGPRPAMTAEDTYTVHFRLAGGCTGVMYSSCAVPGRPFAAMRIVGARGVTWLQRDEVWVDRGAGAEQVPMPDDLPLVTPEPPPVELTEDLIWHIDGTDLAAYTRVCERLRAGILGEPVADDPPVATFADGVAHMAVLDAVRRSAAGAGWVDVESVGDRER